MNAPQALPPAPPRLVVLPGGLAAAGAREDRRARSISARRPWTRSAARWLLVAAAALTCPVEITAVVLLVVLCAGHLLDSDRDRGEPRGDRLSHRGAGGLQVLRP